MNFCKYLSNSPPRNSTESIEQLNSLPGIAVVPVGWATKPSVLVSSPPTCQDPRRQVSTPHCYLKPERTDTGEVQGRLVFVSNRRQIEHPDKSRQLPRKTTARGRNSFSCSVDQGMKPLPTPPRSLVDPRSAISCDAVQDFTRAAHPVAHAIVFFDLSNGGALGFSEAPTYGRLIARRVLFCARHRIHLTADWPVVNIDPSHAEETIERRLLVIVYRDP